MSQGDRNAYSDMKSLKSPDINDPLNRQMHNDNTTGFIPEANLEGMSNVNDKEAKVNSFSIVFVSLYIVIWLFVSVIMFRIVPIHGCSMYIAILINLSIFVSFLLCIFYNPWNYSLHKKINASKQKYDSVKKDTEQTYDTLKKYTEQTYDSIKKDTEQIYQNQIKLIWLNDLNQQIQYYLYGYMLLSFLPFFYVLTLLNPSWYSWDFSNPLNLDKIRVFIVQFSLFYIGLQLFVYSVTVQQWWFMIISIILCLFIFAIGSLNLAFNLFQTIAFVTLLIIISIVTLKISSSLKVVYR